jgi:hypothetical protein
MLFDMPCVAIIMEQGWRMHTAQSADLQRRQYHLHFVLIELSYILICFHRDSHSNQQILIASSQQKVSMSWEHVNKLYQFIYLVT